MSDFINTIDVMGDKELAKAIIESTITEFKDNIIQSIGKFAFSYRTKLTSVDCPNVTEIGESCFQNCEKLVDVNLPMLETVGGNAFQRCSALTRISLPKADMPTFRYCAKLELCDLPSATSVGYNAFGGCSSLKAVILRSTTLVPLTHATAFSDCCHFTGTVNATYNPNGDKDGYAYVPRALVEQYPVETNWAAVLDSDRYRALEDYTVDGTIYGDLDESKI